MQPMGQDPSRGCLYAPTEIGNPKIFDLVRICKRVKIGDVSSMNLLFPGLDTWLAPRPHLPHLTSLSEPGGGDRCRMRSNLCPALVRNGPGSAHCRHRLFILLIFSVYRGPMESSFAWSCIRANSLTLPWPFPLLPPWYHTTHTNPFIHSYLPSSPTLPPPRPACPPASACIVNLSSEVVDRSCVRYRVLGIPLKSQERE